MIIREKAYPRAALIGNPSDGYFGKTIAFVFRNYSAEVTLYESPSLEILPSVLDYNTYENMADLASSITKFGYYGGIRLLKACVKTFYTYCMKEHIQLSGDNFTLRYQSDIPNRLGMAGSSAIITATMRAMIRFFQIEIPKPILANLVLSVELDELGIKAGLQDRVAQVYETPVYMDFNKEHMEKFGYGIYEPIEIPDDLPLFIAYRTDLAEGSEILHSRLALDPDLQLYAGPQFTLKPNFGVFMDSAPDRWGRKLMQRREAYRARREGESPRILMESDYLLGVHDEARMGALRFKTYFDGNFLNDDQAMAAPPWARLRELEEASRRVDDDSTDSEREKWLAMLIAPGSSLGGARPKACVSALDGSQWIAKFPNHKDTSNTSAWEYAVMRMARDAGLNVPEIKLEHFSKYGSTFLTKRFDRNGSERIHFASAMTLLGKTDGADAQQGESYLELAEFIMRYGARPDADLHELWRRIVFSIAVSNTDDHLRNHGFLLAESGWELSPAYDINPNPQGHGLSLNITDTDNSLDFELAMEVAPFFRISDSGAKKTLAKVSSTVAKWRRYATGAGIGHDEQEEMKTAFRVSGH